MESIQETKKVAPTTKEIPSSTHLKGAYFLTGQTDPNAVFIAEEWNEEQKMMFNLIRDFCVKEIQEPMKKSGKELRATKPEDRERVIHLLEQCADLGLCGLSINEAYGGMDMDFNTGVLFTEAFASGFSFATTIGAHTSIGSLPIVYYGTEAQKAKYLPGIATAQIKTAYCLTEPSAGSDANSGKTKATYTDDQKYFLLNGQKMWITNGGFADLFIVFAKIEEDKNLSAFIVEKKFGGITLGEEEEKMGIKGSSTVQVFFDNCRIPEENLLGERDCGFKIALNILNTGRIKLAAGAIGGCKYATTLAVNYAKERKQFGQPIADFGAIKYKLGEMATMAFAIEAGVYRTSFNIDRKADVFQAQGMSPQESKLNAIREFAIECAILKVKASEAVCLSCDEALQIHGGMGYAMETGIEMGCRDARITRIYEGTSEVNRLLSVAELMKRNFISKEVDLMAAGKKIPMNILGNMMPFRSKSGWDEEERIVKNIKHTFLFLSGAAGKKLKEKMKDEQEIVTNLSNILAEAYIAESVLLKVQKLEAKNLSSTAKLSIQKNMVRLYLYEALDVVRKCTQDAIASFASGFEKKSLTFVSKQLLKTYDVNPVELRRSVADYIVEKDGYCF